MMIRIRSAKGGRRSLQEAEGRIHYQRLQAPEQGVSIGRSYRDAPEIDGLVLVKGEIAAGQIVPVMIKEAMVYDLGGEIIKKKQER